MARVWLISPFHLSSLFYGHLEEPWCHFRVCTFFWGRWCCQFPGRHKTECVLIKPRRILSGSTPTCFVRVCTCVAVPTISALFRHGWHKQRNYEETLRWWSIDNVVGVELHDVCMIREQSVTARPFCMSEYRAGSVARDFPWMRPWNDCSLWVPGMKVSQRSSSIAPDLVFFSVFVCFYLFICLFANRTAQ